MKKRIDTVIALAYMLSIPGLNLIYSVLNNPGRGVHSLLTDLDQAIPFVKAFVIPYILWEFFLYGALVYLCFKDRETYYRTLIALGVCIMISYGVYFVYQTTVPRPVLVGNDLLTKLVDIIYKYDQPYNCFPSIHVLSSFLIIKAFHSSKIRTGLNFGLISTFAILIILSTQFIKQHVIFDALAGIMLSNFIFNLICKLDQEGLLLWPKKQYSLSTTKRKYVTW